MSSINTPRHRESVNTLPILIFNMRFSLSRSLYDVSTENDIFHHPIYRPLSDSLQGLRDAIKIQVFKE
jgi:hypothetical protein